MQYRTLPHGKERISVVGLGAAYLTEDTGERGVEEAAEAALEGGINYFDLAGSDATPFKAYGEVFRGVRDKVYLQVHFGADYLTGKYGWTDNIDTIRRTIDMELSYLKTDYIDFGFIHCVDEEKDLTRVIEGGTLEYIKSLKAQGAVRHLGLSSHTPSVVQKALDLAGVIDMIMFSINAAYDFRGEGEFAHGDMGERMALYRRCEADGVGISVMKPFGGGQLLSDRLSPFGKALTPYQCIQYALDKPGVITVLPGAANAKEVHTLTAFAEAPAASRDYSVLGSLSPAAARGVCVYCNHCAPCPAGLDVGLINKYYDLARAGDGLARSHYGNLKRRAGDCTACGRCDRRCPFGAKQSARMKEIQAYFGK